jgi:hypothetical protein
MDPFECRHRASFGIFIFSSKWEIPVTACGAEGQRAFHVVCWERMGPLRGSVFIKGRPFMDGGRVPLKI